MRWIENSYLHALSTTDAMGKSTNVDAETTPPWLWVPFHERKISHNSYQRDIVQHVLNLCSRPGGKLGRSGKEYLLPKSKYAIYTWLMTPKSSLEISKQRSRHTLLNLIDFVAGDYMVVWTTRFLHLDIDKTIWLLSSRSKTNQFYPTDINGIQISSS